MVRHAILLGFVLIVLLLAAPSTAGVTGQDVDYAGSEGEMPARLYVPDGAGRLPAVLVFHTIAGPGPNVDAFARALAEAGYVTLAPDVFALHDFGPDGRTDHPLILGDARGALDYLERHPRVDRDRIGVVGFSFGGRLAALMGALHPEELRAIVVYYAIASHAELHRPLPASAARAVPLTQRVSAFRAPVMIHHGEVDASVPVEQARLFHQALIGAGKSSVLHVYPGADHLFNFALGPDATYEPEAARLSWQRTLDFLARYLKPPASAPK
jgi:carboxymethylenebutenolidase